MHQKERPSEYSALVERHLEYLQRKARVLTGSAAEAEDLIQDTMERALRAYGGFSASPEKNLLACERKWLATIMTRRFIDIVRQKQEQARDVDAKLPAPEPYVPAPWEMVTAGQVELAVRQLDPRFREVFELFHFQQQSYEAISQRLQIPKNTVGGRLARARDKVRKILSAARSKQ